jgi:hypothetical protein
MEEQPRIRERKRAQMEEQPGNREESVPTRSDPRQREILPIPGELSLKYVVAVEVSRAPWLIEEYTEK